MELTHASANQLCLSALELINQLGLSPEPHNYELCYLYCSGAYPELNKTLDKIIDRGEPAPQAEMDQLFDTCLQSDDPAPWFEMIGDKLSEQLTETMGIVHSASDSTSSFGASLGAAGSDLSGLSDPKSIATVLQSLIHATEAMQRSTGELDQRLNESSAKVADLQSDLVRVQQESHMDALTGVGNRRQFDIMLTKEIARARRKHYPLCLCILDIDNFKTINDEFGHAAGDAALRCLAELLTDKVREYDIVTRYGGDEFAVILSDTNEEAAVEIIERVRCSLSENKIVLKSTGKKLNSVTASFGIAQLGESDDVESLMERADRCLYAAKDGGRNRIEFEAA